LLAKYKVGDRVRIVSKQPRCVLPVGLATKMCDHFGTVMTIRTVYNGLYYMEEDQHEACCNIYPGWAWCDQLIEGLAEPKEITAAGCTVALGTPFKRKSSVTYFERAEEEAVCTRSETVC